MICKIFAPPNKLTSKIKLDDEDDDNSNSWHWYNAPEEIKNRIQKIISGKSNTIYNVVKWVKLTLALWRGL